MAEAKEEESRLDDRVHSDGRQSPAKKARRRDFATTKSDEESYVQ